MKIIEKLFNIREPLNENEYAVESVNDERQQELATIQVRDIKEYLVDEYNRSKELFRQNELLKEKLKATEETKLKYEAALVTLDEYKMRLDNYEVMLFNKDTEVSDTKEEMEKIREELNSYKIQISRLSFTKEELKNEIIEEVKEQIIKTISSIKGNLSKNKVIETIQKINITLLD